MAPNKAAALRYKAFLDELGAVSSEVIISPPDEREGFDEIDAEESTDVVVAFWQRMMKRYGGEDDYNKYIVNAFKFGDEPEILIVVDKLLTGFDAPRNTVLYLARRLKDHSLLQAIARVNRLYEDESGGKAKDFGYVIDYVGVLGELDEALTTYSALEGFEASRSRRRVELDPRGDQGAAPAPCRTVGCVQDGENPPGRGGPSNCCWPT